jgi:hypothetical protein
LTKYILEEAPIARVPSNVTFPAKHALYSGPDCIVHSNLLGRIGPCTAGRAVIEVKVSGQADDGGRMVGGGPRELCW